MQNKSIYDVVLGYHQKDNVPLVHIATAKLVPLSVLQTWMESDTAVHLYNEGQVIVEFDDSVTMLQWVGGMLSKDLMYGGSPALYVGLYADGVHLSSLMPTVDTPDGDVVQPDLFTEEESA